MDYSITTIDDKLISYVEKRSPHGLLKLYLSVAVQMLVSLTIIVIVSYTNISWYGKKIKEI